MSLEGFIAFHYYYREALKHPVCWQVGGSPSAASLSPAAVAQHILPLRQLSLLH